MRTLFTTTIALVLAATLAAGPVWAKGHSFRLIKEGHINDTYLAPGPYKLQLDGDSNALIYRGKKLVMKARVEVKPLKNDRIRGSVLQTADGTIREIRLKEQVVVFVP